jgi:hypothetical protein
VRWTIPIPPHSLDPNAPTEVVGECSDLCPDCYQATYGRGLPSLYDAATAAGIPTDHHESDLYLLATPEARALVKARGLTCSTFRHNGDGRLWLEVNFMYAPWWRARGCTA